ncbi:MAG TPA: fused MFS/spermidine synthase [Propionibacteriaceae bacterium]|nr:fused MFS/spermidine synthase [Propionibacteriaceae bacterium]
MIRDLAYPRAFTLRVGRTDQSYVDLDDPRRLEFDYLEQIAVVVDTVAPAGEPVRAVHVGGAAMSVARYVAATRPRSAQLIFEPDAELTAFVRTHLPLPARSGIRVRAVDGRSGVAALRKGSADLVILDAFVGPRTPAELTTLEYWTELRRVLTADGTVIANLTDRGPLGYARRVLAGLAARFTHRLLLAESSTLKGRRFGNVILVGSGRPLAADEIAAAAGRVLYPYRVLSGARLTQLLAEAAPFTDQEAEESPLPPKGMSHFT